MREVLASSAQPTQSLKGRFSLTGNQLKILALISMTMDHIGLIWLHDWTPFRILGRLAFPIFSYMIAEGCRYTRSKRAHFLWVLIPGILFQAVYYIADRSLYQSIFTTFALAIPMIYAVQYAKRSRRRAAWLLPVLAAAFAAFCCKVLPCLLPGTDFAVDYGFWGVILPVLISLGDTLKEKWCLTALGLLLLSLSIGGLQFFSLAALAPLALYGGDRGKWRIKYLFYIYYPLHLVLIWSMAPLFR